MPEYTEQKMTLVQVRNELRRRANSAKKAGRWGAEKMLNKLIDAVDDHLSHCHCVKKERSLM